VLLSSKLVLHYLWSEPIVPYGVHDKRKRYKYY